MKATVYRNSVILFIVAVLGFAILAGVYAAANKGEKAPGFRLQLLSGKYTTLDQLRKNPTKKGATRPVMLVFWATWCPPCREETTTIEKLENKYKSKGLEIAAVALDNGGISDVAPFVKEHKLTYTVLVDPDNRVAEPLYSVRGIPSIFIINKRGVIQNKYTGSYPGIDKDLERDIQSVLK